MSGVGPASDGLGLCTTFVRSINAIDIPREYWGDSDGGDLAQVHLNLSLDMRRAGVGQRLGFSGAQNALLSLLHLKLSSQVLHQRFLTLPAPRSLTLAPGSSAAALWSPSCCPRYGSSVFAGCLFLSGARILAFSSGLNPLRRLTNRLFRTARCSSTFAGTFSTRHVRSLIHPQVAHLLGSRTIGEFDVSPPMHRAWSSKITQMFSYRPSCDMYLPRHLCPVSFSQICLRSTVL